VHTSLSVIEGADDAVLLEVVETDGVIPFTVDGLCVL